MRKAILFFIIPAPLLILTACKIGAPGEPHVTVKDGESPLLRSGEDGAAFHEKRVYLFLEDPLTAVQIDIGQLSRGLRVVYGENREAVDFSAVPTITYLGRGRTSSDDVDNVQPTRIEGFEAQGSWYSLLGYSARSGGEYLVTYPAGDGEDANGLSGEKEGLSPSEKSRAIPERPTRGWSNFMDTRVNIYNENAPVQSQDKWIMSTGNGTAAIVGSRQFITAAHIIYDHETKTWTQLGQAVFVGLNGFSNRQAFPIDVGYIDEGDPHDALWFWIEPLYDSEGKGVNGANDFAIVTVPKVFQFASYHPHNGQFWFDATFIRKEDLPSLSLFERGYSDCDAGSQGDAPCQGHPNQICEPPCLVGHLRGDIFNCAFGGVTVPDATGHERALFHGCDVSNGDSGAPIFASVDGRWIVIGVHSSSPCGSVNDEDYNCADEDAPNFAARLTPNRILGINNQKRLWP